MKLTGLRVALRRNWPEAMVMLLLVLLLAAPGALAWNESAHRVIGAAAAGQMTPELQARVAQLLRAHPRYAQDLVRYQPRRLQGLGEVAWLLGQAGQWPDRARRFGNERKGNRDALVRRYNRGNWHYINLPLYLQRPDAVLGINDPTQTITPGNPQDVLAALTFMRIALKDPATSQADKGLWISWALHLIADVHQPLHTTAMFTKGRWPKGDRGGNEVKIAGSGKNGRLDSLHYYWDSAISNVRKPGEVRRVVGVLNEQVLPAVVAAEIEPVAWIREGRGVAEQVVYGPLRAQLVTSPVVKVSSEYGRVARAVALQRAALAARRTALWLEEALGTAGR